MHAERVLICLEERFGSQLVEYERNMVRARYGEEQSAGLWRREKANAHAQVAAEQEAAVPVVGSSPAAALDNARVHSENRCELLVEGFIRERDRAAVAELVLTDTGVLLREELAMMQVSRGSCLAGQQQRQLESAPVDSLPECFGILRTKATSDPFRVSFLVFGFSCDHRTRCGFVCASTKSFLWLLREIVAKNTKEECETVFCAIGVKGPMVPYLNESCMSFSGMSSGPHGQTSDPAHEFGSLNVSNEQ